MLIHKRHEALLDLDEFLLRQLLLSLNFSQFLLHASQDLRVSLQVTDCLIRLQFVLLGLIGQPAHVLLQLLIFSFEPLALVS